ncbi:MAG: chlorite dismutase family protein [Actinomycetota bacterium]|nr:chlorite dismutase family protein [Actinomycetota bacterium]
MEPTTPEVGLCVVHLFAKLGPGADREAIVAATKRVEAADGQIVSVAMVGHKADVAFMALHPDLVVLRRFQTDLGAAGLDIVDSYVSLTEVSEYAAGVPERMRQMRLYPKLPPKAKPAWCFYPMSKRRDPGGQNWYATPFERRREMMEAHGTTGRKFAGRILQLVTGSTGLDDWEWGVTLFGAHVDDLKEVVYTMRYDRASAHYAEFGSFYTGVCGPLDEVLDTVGLG